MGNKIIKEEFFMTNAEKLVGKEEADKALWRLKLNFYEIHIILLTKNFILV